MLPNDHPLAQFNKYLYLESGTPQMPIYIYKFTETYGVMIGLILNDKVGGFRAKLYPLTFVSDMDWKFRDGYRQIEGSSYHDLFQTIRLKLEIEVNNT